MNKKYLFFILLFFPLVLFFYCHKKSKPKQDPAMESAYEVALEWNKMILKLERHTAGYRPPVSARMFAYVGICAYEVASPRLSPKNKYLPILPDIYHNTAPSEYNLALALNAAYAQLLKSFFATAPWNQLKGLTKLEDKLAQKFASANGSTAENNNIAYQFGQNVANSVWKYSLTDSIGHNAYLYNYDKNYIPPTCKGCWQPSGLHPMPALLPHWGSARTFVVHRSEIACRPPLSFDETHNSSFYTEAMEVFLTAQNRSYEDIWIAEFWGDDLPELTVTPVGRWFSIANQCFETHDYSFEQLIHTYFLLGLGLNDASVICWEAKYRYNVERPESYIQRNISSTWTPLHESPSFPAYPSGHATFGALAVEILKSQLGEIKDFTDKTHEERAEFRGRPRSYPSFDDIAKENAFSRLTMGVHYRMDCEEGFRMGKVIGKKVNDKF
jgi:hypothetical protein